jgi:hypothetical protein
MNSLQDALISNVVVVLVDLVDGKFDASNYGIKRKATSKPKVVQGETHRLTSRAPSTGPQVPAGTPPLPLQHAATY